MEQLNQDKNVRLCYFTVPTNKGVGYICMALRRPEKGSNSISYQAGFSFCSPQEGKQFSKTKARAMAIGRLNTLDRGSENRINFTCDANNLTEVFKRGLEIAESYQFQVEDKDKLTHYTHSNNVKKTMMKWFVPTWFKNRKDLIFGLNVNKSTETVG